MYWMLRVSDLSLETSRVMAIRLVQLASYRAAADAQQICTCTCAVRCTGNYLKPAYQVCLQAQLITAVIKVQTLKIAGLYSKSKPTVSSA